jgi:S1-C subfamily serine protease
MTTDELISRITAASQANDLAGMQRYLRELRSKMRDEGRPIASSKTLILVEALCGTELGSPAGGPDPYKLAATIKQAAAERPIDLNELNTAWETLNGVLADPSTQIDDDQIIEVLEALKGARQFDRLATTAERAIVRLPQDARVRLLYGQALIDSGLVHAGLEMVRTVLALPGVQQRALDEANGLMGRGYKQIYVSHVRKSTASHALRSKFKPALQAAILHYGKTYRPETPAENYWHGINLIALMTLAREDGHSELAHWRGNTPEQLAVRMIDALEPGAESTPDNWVLATLGEASIALRNYKEAKRWYTAFGRHPATQPFHAASASRQLEEVWRISPSHGGAGPLFAVLKAGEIGNPEGKFTLPTKGLGEIAKFAGSREAVDFRESMVSGGEFVPLAELQIVVRRAKAVVAVQDNFGRTIGTGFLLRGADLHDKLSNELVMLTNAHVLSESGGAGTLHPAQAKLVLEGYQNAALACANQLIWESPPSLYDAAIVLITGGRSEAIEPLDLAQPDLPLWSEDKSAGREGSRVSVIGYPLGGPLSLGRVLGANGRLVDKGPRRHGEPRPIYLHYRAPTEPGNSGSPIFETTSWKVVGLHHAGFDPHAGRERLDGKEGTSFANEGICIQAIRAAVRESLSASRGRSIFGS